MSDLHTNCSTGVLQCQSPQLSLPGFEPMAHHNPGGPPRKPYIVLRPGDLGGGYGVPSRSRVLTIGVIRNKAEQVRDCLGGVVGLTRGESEIVMELVRLWACHGEVYCKADHMRQDRVLPFVTRQGREFTGVPLHHCAPGCSKRTFWRAIAVLSQRDLVTVVNRFILRPHAQTSNLYRLDRLILLIARYLAEHGLSLGVPSLARYLRMPGRDFWRRIWGGQAALPFDLGALGG